MTFPGRRSISTAPTLASLTLARASPAKTIGSPVPSRTSPELAAITIVTAPATAISQATATRNARRSSITSSHGARCTLCARGWR